MRRTYNRIVVMTYRLILSSGNNHLYERLIGITKYNNFKGHDLLRHYIVYNQSTNDYL